MRGLVHIGVPRLDLKKPPIQISHEFAMAEI